MIGLRYGWLLVAMAVGSACGPSSSSDDDPGTDDGASTAGDDDGTPGSGTGPGGGPTGTDDGPATTAADDTTTTDEPSTDDDATTGPEACESGPFPGELACEEDGPTEASFTIEGSNGTPRGGIACTVLDDEDDGEVQTLGLTCEGRDETVVLAIRTVEPHTPLQLLPQDVVLEHVIAGEKSPEPYFALRSVEGGLLAAGFDGEIAPPPALIDWSPLITEVPSSDCDAMGSRFEGCLVQRTALRVTFDDATVEVFSGHVDYAGPLVSYAVLVDRATRMACATDRCGYNYPGWGIRAVLVRIPEG